MLKLFKKGKKHKTVPGEDQVSPVVEEGQVLSHSLKDNIALLQKLFEKDDTFIIRPVQNPQHPKVNYSLFYCNGMVKAALINEDIIKPLLLCPPPDKEDLLDGLTTGKLHIDDITKSGDLEQIIRAVTYGDTLLLADGCNEGLLLNTKGFVTRSLSEPENEKVLIGPRDGFTEPLLQNISLIRRRLRTNDLKLQLSTFGKRSGTQVCICYLEELVDHRVLKELQSRMERIDMDGMLDSNYIAEMIRDKRFSPFRTLGYTERPDVVVGKMLEGRIAIVVDGSPSVLTIPYLFIENFQNSEDYYLSFFYTSFARLIRILGFFLTVTIPGLYVAVVAFHQEILPTSLLLNIASERKSVPFPASLEAVIMLLVFDILKETGIRMPSGVGQALSIVGALVIGQAAVEAKLVAAPMIIVVGLTGITSLLIPKMNAPIILARFGLLLASTVLGFYGFLLGTSVLMIHLLNLTSMGIPQLNLTAHLRWQEIKDLAIRAPWWEMLKRPRFLSANHTRMKRNGEEES